MTTRRKIAAIVGLEQYNAGLWKKIKGLLENEAELTQLSDIDLESRHLKRPRPSRMRTAFS